MVKSALQQKDEAFAMDCLRCVYIHFTDLIVLLPEQVQFKFFVARTGRSHCLGRPSKTFAVFKGHFDNESYICASSTRQPKQL